VLVLRQLHVKSCAQTLSPRWFAWPKTTSLKTLLRPPATEAAQARQRAELAAALAEGDRAAHR